MCVAFHVSPERERSETVSVFVEVRSTCFTIIFDGREQLLSQNDDILREENQFIHLTQ